MFKRILTQKDKEVHLKEQIQFLITSAELYDKGCLSEAKRMACCIRTLVHQTKDSNALLEQLGLLDQDFFSTALPYNDKIITPHGGLISVRMDFKKIVYEPFLDDAPVKVLIPFTDWWKEKIFSDGQNDILSRRDLILKAANQDGGAHVDLSIDRSYDKFTDGSGMGWKDSMGNFICGANMAAIRQVAHEILKTLFPSYNKKSEKKGVFVAGFTLESVENNKIKKNQIKRKKIGRNAPCSCGSDKKFKKCHGK